MKKLTFWAVLWLMTTCYAQAQLVTMYDLKVQSIEKEAEPRTGKRRGPRTDKHVLSLPEQDMKVTIWIEHPYYSGMEEILRATTAIIEFDIKGEKRTTDKMIANGRDEHLVIHFVEQIDNRTYIFDYSTTSGKCVYSFFDNPVIPDPMKEYQDKIKTKGF